MIGSSHPFDAADIGAMEFLIAVMRDPMMSLTKRIDAAGRLLRIDPHQRYPYKRAQHHAEGSFSIHNQTSAGDLVSGGLGNNSQKKSGVKATTSHVTDPHPPLNIEKIIADVKSDNFPQPTYCYECGHYMPYPCQPNPKSKAH